MPLRLHAGRASCDLAFLTWESSEAAGRLWRPSRGLWGGIGGDWGERIHRPDHRNRGRGFDVYPLGGKEAGQLLRTMRMHHTIWRHTGGFLPWGEGRVGESVRVAVAFVMDARKRRKTGKTRAAAGPMDR
jgi:hypothetical protein